MAWEFWGSQKSWPLPKEEPSSSLKSNGSLLTNGRSARELKRMLSSSVSFKDLSLPQVEFPADDTSDSEDQETSAEYLAELTGNAIRKPDKKKLIIVLVGLPGRGKTFLCNKLKCYLNWLGHRTQHFNVGQYRRMQKDSDTVQDAKFFDHSNQAGQEARHRAVHAALADMAKYLESDHGQVAIFDATNTTNERRQMLIKHFHGRWQYMFIESICNDRAVLEQNYLNKMCYSPDYHNVGVEQAIADFRARIAKYEEVYEPISDRSLHYIKLIDIVTGRGHMDVNRISGYIPGKIAFFLMQVCKAGMAGVRKIWLTRHGESEFNKAGIIGGDSGLSARGREYARHLPQALISRLPEHNSPISVSVWTSTLQRTIETAGGLPFPKLTWKALDEIDAGVCDGLTYTQISHSFPTEYEARKRDKLRYRYPRGESYLDVIQRLEPVVIEMERERESICIVAHQAVLRAVYGYFMAVPQEHIPSLDIPLHQIIELTPMPDGTMTEARISLEHLTPHSSAPFSHHHPAPSAAAAPPPSPFQPLPSDVPQPPAPPAGPPSPFQPNGAPSTAPTAQPNGTPAASAPTQPNGTLPTTIPTTSIPATAIPAAAAPAPPPAGPYPAATRNSCHVTASIQVAANGCLLDETSHAFGKLRPQAATPAHTPAASI